MGESEGATDEECTSAGESPPAIVDRAILGTPCLAQSYADLILADQPFAYWRLDETSQGAAENLGTSLAESATLVGGEFLELGVPGLADPNNTAARFKGLDEDLFFDDGTISGGRVNIADSLLTNTGTSVNKTIELWFQADNADTDVAQILFEEGGSTRGAAIYVLNGEVVVGIHNSADDDGAISSPWPGGTGADRELALAKASIESNTPYHVVMVMEGDEDGFEGTVTGYLNGEQIGQVDGIGRIFSHADDTAIGGLRGQTLFEDGGLGDDIDPELRFFQGVIDEVALYDTALSAGRIGIHFGDEVSADANGDGNVDFADFLLISANFNSPGTLEQGDIDLDGQVGMSDFITWRRQFTAQGPAAASIPEPSTSGLVLMGILALPFLRRRRAD